MTEPARRLDLDDPDALRDALRALLPQVRRWLHRLLGRSPDLDDATQDVMIELARSLPQFEGRSTIETFAHTITVRVAYRYFGRAPEVSLEVVPELVDRGSGMGARLAAREALARLQRALRKLPAKRRVAFVLCAVEGMTPAQAAEVAGTTALAMRCRLMWSRRELARMLKGDPYLAAYVGPEDEP